MEEGPPGSHCSEEGLDPAAGQPEALIAAGPVRCSALLTGEWRDGATEYKVHGSAGVHVHMEPVHTNMEVCVHVPCTDIHRCIYTFSLCVHLH
jgi:hypothetical protein